MSDPDIDDKKARQEARIEFHRKELESLCERDPKALATGYRPDETNLDVQRRAIKEKIIHFCEGAPTPKLTIGPVTLCGCCRP